MNTVRSQDGTSIAYEQSGKGPALIMVVGAFNDRSTAMPLSKFLEGHFTTINYDRRGRGDSGDTLPYGVEREVEDLAALIKAAGGSAHLFGFSSGAVLSVKAAAQGLPITKLALYESPPISPTDPIIDQLRELVETGRRGDAVELFQASIGLPSELIAQLRHAPFRPGLEKMAHTLVYEMTLINDKTLLSGDMAAVNAPTLVIDGANSPPVMHHASQALAKGIPGAQYRSLAGQDHNIVPEVLAPVIVEFLVS
jgi:pimeloyl-ACP methyl ester carboxylesterase